MAMLRRTTIVLFLLVTLGAGAWRLRARSYSPWQRLAPDLELRVLQVRAAGTFSGEVKVIALRTRASRVHVVRGATLEAGEWRRRESARVVINGGYFGEDGKSLGLRICDGRRFGSLHPANWGVFFIEDGHAKVLHTRDFAKTHKSLQGISQAIQCGPRLVVNGRVTDLKPQTARRSALGIQRDGRVILAVSDGVLSFDEWAALWASKDGLNCRDALNLDGGGSTQISLVTSRRSLEISGSWPVPDAVAIK
jgi:exopolysaccharide biosynthesis protein